MNFTHEQCNTLLNRGFILYPENTIDKTYAMKRNDIITESIDCNHDETYAVNILIWYGSSFTGNFQPDESDGGRDGFEFEINIATFRAALNGLQYLKREIRSNLNKLLLTIK